MLSVPIKKFVVVIIQELQLGVNQRYNILLAYGPNSPPTFLLMQSKAQDERENGENQ